MFSYSIVKTDSSLVQCFSFQENIDTLLWVLNFKTLFQQLISILEAGKWNFVINGHKRQITEHNLNIASCKNNVL